MHACKVFSTCVLYEPMRTFVRYLLWLLIALLPLQGGAVALMPYGSAPASAGVAVSGLPAMSHYDRQQNLEHSAQVSKKSCHEAGDSATVNVHERSSHCGSCCIGASVPATVQPPDRPVTFVTPVRIAAETAMIAFIPATPERPPRRVL